MVKPDLKHNYYQDLDLPTTASVDDVRKAYRKLALQFHPDRNAGREEECVPRFQAIQAANEILSDPTSKAKYDADRRKVGLYPSPSKPSTATTGNPYAARSDFPPPPRRTQPGTYQRPNAPTQPTGADRFANFARTAGSTPQKNPAADRTQQFRAWQNMKEPNTAPRPPPPDVPPRQPPPRSPQPPTPGAAPTSARPRMGRKNTQLPTEEKIRAGMRYGTTTGPSVEEAASHQSAWQAFQQQKNSGQRRQPPPTPKRTGGFDPSAPGSDEKAAPQSSHYVHRHRSEDFGRAAGFPPPPPGPPPASASHSPTSPNAQRPFADPLRPFKSRTSNADAPYAEGNRTSTPYSSYSGEKTAFTADGLRRSASVRDTTKLSPESMESTSSRARSVDPANRRKQAKRGSPTSNGRGNGFAAAMFDADSEDTSDDEDIDSAPEEAPVPAQPSVTSSNTAQHGGSAARNIKTPKPPSRFINRNGTTSQFPPAENDGAAHTDGEQADMQQRKKSENIFAFPIDSDTFKQTSGKSRSVEEINTNFSPGGFHGKFEGSGDYFTDTNSRRPSPAHRQSSRRGQRSATTDSAPISNGTSPNPNVHHNADEPSVPGSGPFSQEAWQKTFSSGGTFWPPPPPNPPASKVPSRKGSRVNRATGNGPALSTAKQSQFIDDDDNVAEVDRSGHPVHGSATVDEGDAMDIDTPPQATNTSPPEQGTPSHGLSVKEARLYSVEPSEWRQQQTQHHRPTSSSIRRAERKSAGESGFNVDLDDLRHTEPFVRNNEGLKNLGDLSSSLPFASKASSALPTEKPHVSKAMIKPAPTAPDGPTKLTRTSWEAYAQNFSNYLAKVQRWNCDYLRHFESFDRESQEYTRSGCGWLLQSGDTVHGPGGFNAYRRSVQEESQSREAWSKGREVHLEALRDFDKIRDRVRSLVELGNLADV